MKQFTNFNDLYDLLAKSFVLRYSEYDESGRCFFTTTECMPFVNKNNLGMKQSISLRNMKTGQIDHKLKKENDFDYGNIETVSGSLVITLYNKSGFKTVINLRKM